MKNFFKFISILVVIAAVVGGVILVQRNQETRRGAAANETSTSLLPTAISSAVGKNVTMQLWVSTGKDTDKLSGAEITVTYNSNILKFVKYIPVNTKYTLLNETSLNKNTGTVELKFVALGDEVGGAIQLGKLNFLTLGGGSAKVEVKTGSKIMVSGQGAMWDISKFGKSTVTIAGPTPTGGPGSTVSPTKPPVVDVCYPVNDNFEGTTINNSYWGKWTNGNGSSDVLNGQLRINLPSSTGPVAASIDNWKSNKLILSDDFAAEITIVSSVSVPGASGNVNFGLGIAKDGDKRYVGIIRNPDNPSALTVNVDNLAVGSSLFQLTKDIGNTGPVGVKISRIGNVIKFYYNIFDSLGYQLLTEYSNFASGPLRVIISATNFLPKYSEVTGVYDSFKLTCGNPLNTATLSSRVTLPNIAVGGSTVAILSAKTGKDKISVINARAIFNPAFFEIVAVGPVAGATVVKKTINKTTGMVDLYLTWNGSADKLLTNYDFARVMLKAKKKGTSFISYGQGYPHEVSGVDVDNKSISFGINYGALTRVTIGGTIIGKCNACPSGPIKELGNANCDGSVNASDFEVWRSEVFDLDGLSGKVSADWKADFNCDQKVSLSDFENWRKSVFN